MSRTITVKGIGHVSVKPDMIELSMSLDSRHKEYDKGMEIAADAISALTKALVDVGFQKDAIKTTNFDVDTQYENVKDRFGNYHSEFRGYRVNHELTLKFDLDMKRLSEVLSAIGSCPANPEFSISFTVKDATAINEELLRSATHNARRKAEILCEASGVSLANLLSIQYSWAELDIYSRTEYETDCPVGSAGRSIDIEPDDINVSDTATFVWEIS